MTMWTTRHKMLGAFALTLAGLVLVSASPVPTDVTESRAQPFHGDELLVYQNGFCQVHQTIHLTVRDGRATVELPEGTLLDTLRLFGIKVLEIESRPINDILSPGDHVVVATTRETVEGTIFSLHPRLVLETGNGTRILEPGQVVSIELVGAAPIQPGRIRVELRVDAEDGDHDVKSNYILRGLGWGATHRIDVDSGHFETWIALSGSPGMTVDRLKIVSGSPRFVMWSEPGGIYRDHYVYAMASTGASDSAGKWSPGTLDEYHEYTLDHPVTLEQGRELRLLLFEDTFDLRHEYVAHTGLHAGAVDVQHEWVFTSPLEEPLPQGAASFYRDGRFIGQDRMDYLARAEEVRLVSGYALDIPAEVATQCTEYNQVSFRVAVTNRKSEPVDVIVELSLPERSRLLSEGIFENESSHTWRLDLSPDATETVSGVAAVEYRC